MRKMLINHPLPTVNFSSSEATDPSGQSDSDDLFRTASRTVSGQPPLGSSSPQHFDQQIQLPAPAQPSHPRMPGPTPTRRSSISNRTFAAGNARVILSTANHPLLTISPVSTTSAPACANQALFISKTTGCPGYDRELPFCDGISATVHLP